MSDTTSQMALRAMVPNERAVLALLWEEAVLPSVMKCPGKGPDGCGAIMKQHKKKGRNNSTWRCPRRRCRKKQTIRVGNTFLYYVTNPTKRDSKLSLESILELIWFFLHTNCSIRATAQQTHHSTETVVEWWHTCRMVCSSILEKEPPFEGTRLHPVQIDESYFSGRRKYSRGRLLQGDRARVRSRDEDGDEVPNWGEEEEEFGRDGEGWAWVVGIYFSRTQVRFVRVKSRTSSTLLRVIKKYVKEGSLIWTDEFKSYRCLSQNGYEHEAVNHSQNYVDPMTRAHTQGVERAWLDAKVWYRASRGNRTLLQGHLDECSWRKLRTQDKEQGTLFKAFLRDISTCYRLW